MTTTATARPTTAPRPPQGARWLDAVMAAAMGAAFALFCQLMSGQRVSMAPPPLPDPGPAANWSTVSTEFRAAAGSWAHTWFELATTSWMVVVVAGMAVAAFVTTAIVNRVAPYLLDGHWIVEGLRDAGVGATCLAAFFLGFAVMGGGGIIAAGCTVAGALLWCASAVVHPDTTTAS